MGTTATHYVVLGIKLSHPKYFWAREDWNEKLNLTTIMGMKRRLPAKMI